MIHKDTLSPAHVPENPAATNDSLRVKRCSRSPPSNWRCPIAPGRDVRSGVGERQGVGAVMEFAAASCHDNRSEKYGTWQMLTKVKEAKANGGVMDLAPHVNSTKKPSNAEVTGGRPAVECSVVRIGGQTRTGWRSWATEPAGRTVGRMMWWQTWESDNKNLDRVSGGERDPWTMAFVCLGVYSNG